MKFCSECESMLYPKEGEEGGLYGECPNCGNSELLKDHIIQQTLYRSSITHDISSKIYMIYDPSLPRTKQKECPNLACPSQKDKSLQEAVVYNDPKTLKVTYICAVCQAEWKYS